MRKVILTLFVSMVCAIWDTNYAQCFVAATEQEGPYVELTGILAWDAYPCMPDEVCRPCLTLVLRTRQQTYYLTGSKIEEFVFPEGESFIKVVVNGVANYNDAFYWFKVEDIRLSEDPITTNINTYGYVQDESGEKLSNIRVIVHSADWTVSDTVYSQVDGSFFSMIKNIEYPANLMDVTAEDSTGIYETKSYKNISYTYDCGMDFNPETNIASNELPLIFALKKATEDIVNVTVNRNLPKKTIRSGYMLIEHDGRTFNAYGAEVK